MMIETKYSFARTLIWRYGDDELPIFDGDDDRVRQTKYNILRLSGEIAYVSAIFLSASPVSCL